MAEEEIPMYCCLPFSYAVNYGSIAIDTEWSQVEQSSLSDSEKKEIRDKLYEQHITNITADYFHIIILSMVWYTRFNCD
jgi:hypothetical protein